MIGEKLNKKQVACLQAIADASMGAIYTSIELLYETIEASPNNFNCLLNGQGKCDPKEIDELIVQLDKEYLLESTIHKKTKKRLVGLSDDGKRCNRISVVL